MEKAGSDSPPQPSQLFSLTEGIKLKYMSILIENAAGDKGL